MLKCLPGAVKWWRVVNNKTHVLLSENNCHEEAEDVYGESDTGETEFFGNDPPIDFVTWDYDRLPDSELLNVARFVMDCNVKGLIMIHNKYQLSGMSFCCDSDGVVENFQKILKIRGYDE